MHRRPLCTTGFALAALVAALFGLAAFGGQHTTAAGPGWGGVGFALADGTTECGGGPAVATASTFECDYKTTAPIPNGVGADFTLTINAPAGTTFVAYLGPALPAGCVAAVAANVFTISGCTGGPIATGTVLQLTVLGGPTAGTISMTAVYIGGPTVPGITFGYDFMLGTPPGPASVVTLAATPGVFQSVVCTNTTLGKAPGSPIIVGDSFDCTVTFTAPNSAGIVAVNQFGPPPGGVNYTLTGALHTTGVGPTNYYLCGSGPANTPCTTAHIAGVATAPGPINFALVYAVLGGNPGVAGNFTAATPGGLGIIVGGTPTISAIGCVNANDQTLIQFPTQPGVLGAAVISSSNQNNTVNAAGVAVTPASLSIIAPTNAGNGFGAFFSAVTCGAAFQDNDGDPNVIDGGSITFILPNALGFAQGGLGQILESNGNSFTVPCGSAVVVVETCQGANTVVSGTQTICPPPADATCVAEPTAANVVHVALRPNVSFSLIGGFAPVITISATYNRFLSYGPAFALTTGQFAIGLTAPVYSLALTPTPNTIPAALGSTTGSVITASLSRVVVAACAPIAAFGAFTICPVPGAIIAFGFAVQTLTPGAEPGVVTFLTTSGVFGNPATVNAGSQQVASVHCGAAAATAPIFLTPVVGQLFQFSLTSCTSVSVTLFGGGAAGTAIVTATYVADYTGSTATAATTVTLSATAPTVTLTRGCNEVITGPTVAVAATSAIILALVSPSSAVVSIWQFNNALHAFQAFYFSTAGAPLDINSVGPNQSIFICVNGTATFTTS